MMSLSMVSIVAYITATLMRSKPIYESLLENLLRKLGRKVTKDHGQKILVNYVVRQGSRLEDALISEIRWPENCLLVSIQRGTQEIIPKGRTMLLTGDTIVTMTDERDRAVVHDKMERLCSDMF